MTLLQECRCSHERAILNYTERFFKKWKTSFRKFLGFRRMPEDTLEFIIKDQNIFMKKSNESVKRKIHNHRNNVIKLNIKKKKERIRNEHIPNNLKVLKAFAEYKRDQTIQE